MRISEYEAFVRNSDWTGKTSSEERIRIARYGVAAEVGSLAAAIKRKILHHPAEHWATANEEIIEELGDCLWYTTQLSLIDSDGGLAEVIAADLNALPKEIEDRPQFLVALAPGNYQKFLQLASNIKRKSGRATLNEYQSAAILTARTDGKELLDVCVTRLMLYATSIMSRQFPDREYHLKDDILKFTPNRTLGMLLWHVSAVAKIYSLPLDFVAQENQKKIESIANLGERPPTPLYDRVEGIPVSQQC